MKEIFKWLLGVGFVATGILRLASNFLPSFLYIIVGLFLIPPVLHFFEVRNHIIIPRPLKYVVVVVGLLVALAVDSPTKTKPYNEGITTADTSSSRNYSYNASGKEVESELQRRATYGAENPECLKWMLQKDTYGTFNKDDLDRIIHYATTEEYHLIEGMVQRGDAVFLKKNLVVYVEDVDFLGPVKVRISQTEVELYIVSGMIENLCD